MVEIQGKKGLINIRLALGWEGDEAHRIFIGTLFNIGRQRILVQKNFDVKKSHDRPFLHLPQGFLPQAKCLTVRLQCGKK